MLKKLESVLPFALIIIVLVIGFLIIGIEPFKKFWLGSQQGIAVTVHALFVVFSGLLVLISFLISGNLGLFLFKRSHLKFRKLFGFLTILICFGIIVFLTSAHLDYWMSIQVGGFLGITFLAMISFMD